MKKNPENLRLSASQKGFTLLEVLIALAILSVGLLGMASLTASVIRTNSFSDDFTAATALAQDKLEAIANGTWSSTTEDAILTDSEAGNNTSALLLSTAITDNQENVDENGTVGAGGFFTRTWNIWDRTDIINPAARKDIAVIVSWTSDYGTTKSISVSTIKSKEP
ncbi:MAG: prepilin-type N-terminal cleavage/methylation domain-containing protein [Thermodesulfobacteriota bacterium]